MIYKFYSDFKGDLHEGVSRINDDGSVSYIPNASDNSDWQMYQEWLALGNEPEPADEE